MTKLKTYKTIITRNQASVKKALKNNALLTLLALATVFMTRIIGNVQINETDFKRIMMIRLKNKVVIITGATGAISEPTARLSSDF